MLVQQSLEFRFAAMSGDGPRMKTALGEQSRVPTYVNEFWTSKQRAANSLHEVSYRACFKPQLPLFFIQRLTCESDLVYDPVMGRRTTLIEAALLGRVPCGAAAATAAPHVHSITMPLLAWLAGHLSLP